MEFIPHKPLLQGPHGAGGSEGWRDAQQTDTSASRMCWPLARHLPLVLTLLLETPPPRPLPCLHLQSPGSLECQHPHQVVLGLSKQVDQPLWADVETEAREGKGTRPRPRRELVPEVQNQTSRLFRDSKREGAGMGGG